MARLPFLLAACLLASACVSATDDLHVLPTTIAEPSAAPSAGVSTSPAPTPAPPTPPPLPAGGATIAPPDLSQRTVDCTAIDGPCDYGDDAELDALWDACTDGFGGACDRLYYDSLFDSRYEQFGNTCGDRGLRIPCPDRLT
jgi:hypothetical protein